MKLADIHTYKNGRKKITFFELGIYDLLKNKLGFRYTKINDKGHYLKEFNGIYKVVNFFDLRDEFVKYLGDDFGSMEISKEIDFHTFENEYYKINPIRNGHFAKSCLKRDFYLSPFNEHLILLEIDSKYRYTCEKEEILNFFNIEKFTENIDNVGNFSKGTPIFYKKISKKYYLVFVVFCNSTNQTIIIDFYKVESESEKDFLIKKTNKFILISSSFNLDRDRTLYESNKLE